MMGASYAALLLASSASFALAQTLPYITTSIDIPTECKTCPYSVCANKLAYGDYTSPDDFNVTCYTFGDPIVSDNTWLKTQDGCYVTQYDLVEYAGDYLEALAYCGDDSLVRNITTQAARTKYKSECRYSPDGEGDNVAYLLENTDLTLACWTDEDTLPVLDDPTWFKTTNSCYVSQTGLFAKPDKTKLENCGPIPHLEYIDHNPGPEDPTDGGDTTDTSQRRSAAPEPGTQAALYLWTNQVGEEYSYCRTCYDVTCPSVRRYEFNQTVTFQCFVEPTEERPDYWVETTDFCYVNMTEYWEEDLGYRKPQCAQFVDGGSKLKGRNRKLW